MNRATTDTVMVCNEEIAGEGSMSTAKHMRLSLIKETSLMQSAEAESHVQAEICKYIGICDDSTALEFWEKNESISYIVVDDKDLFVN